MYQFAVPTPLETRGKWPPRVREPQTSRAPRGGSGQMSVEPASANRHLGRECAEPAGFVEWRLPVSVWASTSSITPPIAAVLRSPQCTGSRRTVLSTHSSTTAPLDRPASGVVHDWVLNASSMCEVCRSRTSYRSRACREGCPVVKSAILTPKPLLCETLVKSKITPPTVSKFSTRSPPMRHDLRLVHGRITDQ